MPSDAQAAISNAPKPEALYAKLEDRILARDQKGASEVYYDLVRQRRPMAEVIAEAVRIHAPYTHVPYHERIDDGYRELGERVFELRDEKKPTDNAVVRDLIGELAALKEELDLHMTRARELGGSTDVADADTEETEAPSSEPDVTPEK